MERGCKNCAYASRIYIWSDNVTSVMCDYHKCEINGTGCGKWMPKNMGCLYDSICAEPNSLELAAKIWISIRNLRTDK